MNTSLKEKINKRIENLEKESKEDDIDNYEYIKGKIDALKSIVEELP